MRQIELGAESKFPFTFYILDVFTEKPCSKPFEHNVLYIPIITLSHATSQNLNCVKTWLSIICLDVGNVIDAVRLLAKKTVYKCFTASILALI